MKTASTHKLQPSVCACVYVCEHRFCRLHLLCECREHRPSEWQRKSSAESDLLTEGFEELRAGELPIEEQRVVDGVVGPTHADQEDVQAAWGHEGGARDHNMAGSLID